VKTKPVEQPVAETPEMQEADDVDEVLEAH